MGVNEHVTFGTFEQTEIFCSVQIELFRKESSKKRCHGVELLIKHAVGFFCAPLLHNFAFISGNANMVEGHCKNPTTH